MRTYVRMRTWLLGALFVTTCGSSLHELLYRGDLAALPQIASGAGLDEAIRPGHANRRGTCWVARGADGAVAAWPHRAVTRSCCTRSWRRAPEPVWGAAVGACDPHQSPAVSPPCAFLPPTRPAPAAAGHRNTAALGLLLEASTTAELAACLGAAIHAAARSPAPGLSRLVARARRRPDAGASARLAAGLGLRGGLPASAARRRRRSAAGGGGGRGGGAPRGGRPWAQRWAGCRRRRPPRRRWAAAGRRGGRPSRWPAPPGRRRRWRPG
jgi:hypothetical protein